VVLDLLRCMGWEQSAAAGGWARVGRGGVLAVAMARGEELLGGSHACPLARLQHQTVFTAHTPLLSLEFRHGWPLSLSAPVDPAATLTLFFIPTSGGWQTRRSIFC
jgi:hypothetical protein